MVNGGLIISGYHRQDNRHALKVRIAQGVSRAPLLGSSAQLLSPCRSIGRSPAPRRGWRTQPTRCCSRSARSARPYHPARPLRRRRRSHLADQLGTCLQYCHHRRLCGFSPTTEEGRDAICARRAYLETGSIVPVRSQGRKRRVPPRRYGQNLCKMARLIPMSTQMVPA